MVSTFLSSLLAGSMFLNGAGQIDLNNNYQQDFVEIRELAIAGMRDKQRRLEEEKNPKYRVEEAIITYYTASDDECGKADGITASGRVAREGRTVAADHLPIGTIIEIEGVQYVVEDRFGGGYNNKIDIYTSSRDHAIKQGKRKVNVKIYEEL